MQSPIVLAAATLMCVAAGFTTAAPATASVVTEAITIDLSADTVANNRLTAYTAITPFTVRTGDTLNVTLRFAPGEAIQFTNFAQGNEDISLALGSTVGSSGTAWSFTGKLLDPVGVPASGTFTASDSCNCVYADTVSNVTAYSLGTASTASFDGIQFTGTILSSYNAAGSGPFTGNYASLYFTSTRGLSLISIPAATVAEPASLALFSVSLVGLAGIGGHRRESIRST